MTAPRFSLVDLDRALLSWPVSCGPAAFAVICGLTLDEAHVHFPGFRGWCNPTQMRDALVSAQQQHDIRWNVVTANAKRESARPDWPSYGLACIQFDGPWMASEVPVRVRYRYTHWVGVQTLSERALASGERDLAIWDINAFAQCGSGWLEDRIWRAAIVPLITADIKRASGGWHVTHAIEVVR